MAPRGIILNIAGGGGGGRRSRRFGLWVVFYDCSFRSNGRYGQSANSKHNSYARKQRDLRAKEPRLQ